MKPKIDFSEVTEINNDNNDGFYRDVLNNSHIVHLYKMNKEIDFYFFEEFYMERKDLNDKEYYANELDKIIKYIDYMNLASGKRLNTQELIDKKTNYYLNWILNLFHTKKYLKFRE